MSSAYREGIVTSYLPEKGYGFITGHDQNSYFFTASAFPDEVPVQINQRVGFEAEATPQGFSANAVRSLGLPLSKWANPEHFLVTEHDFFDGDYEVVHVFTSPCWAAASLHDEARQKLIDEAKQKGATGLICLRTSSLGQMGLIHMEGVMVYVQARVPASSEAEVQAANERVGHALVAAKAVDDAHAIFINANAFSAVTDFFARILRRA